MNIFFLHHNRGKFTGGNNIWKVFDNKQSSVKPVARKIVIPMQKCPRWSLCCICLITGNQISPKNIILERDFFLRLCISNIFQSALGHISELVPNGITLRKLYGPVAINASCYAENNIKAFFTIGSCDRCLQVLGSFVICLHEKTIGVHGYSIDNILYNQ